LIIFQAHPKNNLAPVPLVKKLGEENNEDGERERVIMFAIKVVIAEATFEAFRALGFN